jgi:hypothetical protein
MSGTVKLFERIRAYEERIAELEHALEECKLVSTHWHDEQLKRTIERDEARRAAEDKRAALCDELNLREDQEALPWEEGE